MRSLLALSLILSMTGDAYAWPWESDCEKLARLQCDREGSTIPIQVCQPVETCVAALAKRWECAYRNYDTVEELVCNVSLKGSRAEYTKEDRETCEAAKRACDYEKASWKYDSCYESRFRTCLYRH